MADPQVIQVMRQFKAALLQEERAQMREMAGRWQIVEDELQDQIRALTEAIEELKKDGKPVDRGKLYQMERYHRLLAQLKGEIGRYTQYAGQRIAKQQKALGTAGIQHATAAIDASYQGIGVTFDRLPIEAVEHMAGLTRHGTPVDDLLKQAFPDAAVGMTNALVKGTALGWNPRKTAQKMADGMAHGLNRVLKIARTEQLRVYREATRLQYQASGLVEGYYRLAAHDPRTCLLCLLDEGRFYPLRVVIWDHPQGRCTTVPKVTGMPDLQWETGPEWFEKQPEDVQRQMMGHERYDAWKAGKFPLDKLLSRVPDKVWGDGFRLTSLEELLAGKGGVHFRMGTATKPATAAKKTVSEFPTTVESLETVKTLGGSTGAQLVRDPATGKQYVLKRGNSPEHLLEETYADAAYRALGADVPKFKVYDTPHGPAKLAEFIEGRTLKAVMDSGDTAEIARVRKILQQHFAADALLGNWDVIGLGYDNILVGADGRVWRIDNGGGLRYRAQGALKSADTWNEHVTELRSLRDPSVNRQTADVFGGIGPFELAGQIEQLLGQRKALLKALPKDLHPTVEGRLNCLKDVSSATRLLEADRWNEAYIGEFTRHMVGIMKERVISGVPEKLTVRGTTVYKGSKEWDDLRGASSVISKMDAYMAAHGGDFEVIKYWMGRQGGSSWSTASQVLKYHIATQRGGDYDTYYWRDGVDQARVTHEKAMVRVGQEKYEDSWVMWHAFNFQLLRHTEFRHNDIKNGVVRLTRTEERSVMRSNGLNPGDTGVTMQRGAAESASIFKTVKIYGTEVTVQDVPHHRILGLYFYEREPGSRSCPFLNDGENEFVFIPEGIRFDYLK